MVPRQVCVSGRAWFAALVACACFMLKALSSVIPAATFSSLSQQQPSDSLDSSCLQQPPTAVWVSSDSSPSLCVWVHCKRAVQKGCTASAIVLCCYCLVAEPSHRLQFDCQLTRLRMAFGYTERAVPGVYWLVSPRCGVRATVACLMGGVVFHSCWILSDATNCRASVQRFIASSLRNTASSLTAPPT